MAGRASKGFEGTDYTITKEGEKMIDEKELERVCRLAGLMKITTAKIPTYRTKEGTAAVELTKDGLKAFWFIDGERNYEKVMDDAKICSVLQCFEEKGVIEAETWHPSEPLEHHVQPGEKSDSVVSTLIPETFTMELMEKWRVMKVEARMAMFQNTAKEYIEKRPGAAGKQLSFVKGNVMVQELNIAFLFDWSSTIEEVKETDTGYWVRGFIDVNFNGQRVKRSAIGTADKHKGVNSEDVAKAAAMDMIKKAASFLGFNGDVYRGEV